MNDKTQEKSEVTQSETVSEALRVAAEQEEILKLTEVFRHELRSN